MKNAGPRLCIFFVFWGEWLAGFAGFPPCIFFCFGVGVFANLSLTAMKFAF